MTKFSKKHPRLTKAFAAAVCGGIGAAGFAVFTITGGDAGKLKEPILKGIFSLKDKARNKICGQ